MVSTNRFDDSQNSILAPNFQDQQDYKERQFLPATTSQKSYSGYAQSLDRVQTKISGIQNKIASMNGQIILNLNQSIFNNMQHQLLQQQHQQQVAPPIQRTHKLGEFTTPRKQSITNSLPLDNMKKNMFVPETN